MVIVEGVGYPNRDLLRQAEHWDWTGGRVVFQNTDSWCQMDESTGVGTLVSEGAPWYNFFKSSGN